MNSLFVAFFSLVASTFRTRAALQAEILALRHQLTVLQKNAPPRLRLQRSDRFLWSCSRDAGRVGGVVCTSFAPIRDRLAPPSVRVVLDAEITAASGKTERGRRNSRLDSEPEPSHPLWGAPRIHGELLKLGIEVAQSTVAKYLRRPRKPPSQTWRTFLTNHDGDLPPSVCVVVLSHARRRVLHFQVTEHPDQEWTMQQMREAFPWDHGCRYLLRDRDAIYGGEWVAMTKGMGMEEVTTGPRSP
jgi:putative transposase